MVDISGQHLTATTAPAKVGPDWLTALRAQGLTDYQAQGLPSRRVENWHYTDLADLRVDKWAPRSAIETPRLDTWPEDLAEPIGGPCLVLFQGHIQPHLSTLDDLPDGVALKGLAAALEGEGETGAWRDRLGGLIENAAMPMAALNTAHIVDGAVLRIEDGADIATPIHIVSFGAGELADGSAKAPVFHPRLLVVAEAGSSATVIEHHLGIGPRAYLSNAVAEIYVGEGARLTHIKLQNEASAATHLALAHVDVAARATYDGFVLQMGASLGRHEAVLALGNQAHCTLNGAYLAADKQHLDNTVRVDHRAPLGTSRLTFKGVLTGASRGVYQGKIKVDKDAQKTDSQQMSRVLLLDPKAWADTKPELEIYADDVKCGHGATIGELSADALFYLTARGIDRDVARGLLIGAFVTEVVATIGQPDARDLVGAMVDRWLAAHIGDQPPQSLDLETRP